MTHQQGSLGGVLETFAPIWKMGLCVLYHETKMFTQRENAIYLQWCYLLAMANVFFIVKKYVENAFFRDLEIQIY